MIGLAFLLALPANAYRQAQLVPAYDTLLEYSWISDMHSQLVAGRWAGRDFIYTYGPLRQLLHSAGAWIGSGDLAARLRFDRLLVSVLGVAGVWWLLAKTNAAWGWQAALLLLWFGCDFELHTKPLAAILIAAAFGRWLAEPNGPTTGWRRGLAYFAWASAAPLAMLYCFDLGVAIAVWMPCFLGIILIATWGCPATAVAAPRRRAILMLTSACAGMTLFGVVLYTLPGWTNYFHDSWLVAEGYLTQMAYPLSGEHACVLVTAAIIALVTLAFALRQLRKDWQRQQIATSGLLELIALGSLSLIWLRYGLTRSDPPHVLDAVIPIVFYWGCLAPARLSVSARGDKPEGELTFQLVIWLLPAVLLSKFLIAPETAAVYWSDRWQALTSPAIASTSLVMDEASQRAVAAARELPGDKLIVWPNESFLAQAAGKVNPTYPLQSFMAMNPDLEQATIERYDQLPATPVLLVRLGHNLDSVSHIARAPDVFRYLIEHFEMTANSTPEFAILNRSAVADRGWRAHTVPLPAGSIVCKLREGGVATILLTAPEDDVRASDLLFLDVSTSAVPRSLTGKAARLLIKLTLDSGQHQVRYVPLRQGVSAQRIGVSYLEPSDTAFVAAYFGSAVTHAAQRIVKIECAWQPLDFLTPLPDELFIHHLEYLRREGSPTQTPTASTSPSLRASR